MKAKPLRGPEVIDAKIEFLMEEAPHELLQEGERFLFSEGRKLVAKGVIIASSLASPNDISDFEVALLG